MDAFSDDLHRELFHIHRRLTVTKDDGGPAFPAAQYETEHGDKVYPVNSYEGLSMRDWFAGMALQGLLAKQAHSTTFRPGDDAIYCYKIADAMLKERNK